MQFFADSYAIVSYFKGSADYRKLLEENEITTTRLNLMEAYYAALSEANEELANEYYETMLGKCIEIEDETIKKAMQFRLKTRREKKNFSYVDAIGYQIALEKGIKFLTGDAQFKGMKNVEYVK